MAKLLNRKFQQVGGAAAIAVGVVLGFLFLILYWPHLAWCFYHSTSADVSSVRAIPEANLKDVAIPNDWSLRRFDHLSLQLPSERTEAETTPAAVVLLEGDRSLLVEKPYDSEVIFDETPLRVDSKKPIGLVQLRRDILSASPDDFHWSMRRNEVRWLNYYMLKRRSLLLAPVTDVEYISEEGVEKLLMFCGDRAVLVWETTDRQLNGMITFVDLSDKVDFDWMRAATKSLVVHR